MLCFRGAGYSEVLKVPHMGDAQDHVCDQTFDGWFRRWPTGELHRLP